MKTRGYVSCFAVVLSLFLALMAFAKPHFQMRDLGTLGGDWSVAFEINNRGQVAGFSRTADGSLRAFIWPANR